MGSVTMQSYCLPELDVIPGGASPDDPGGPADPTDPWAPSFGSRLFLIAAEFASMNLYQRSGTGLDRADQG
jgi:hypothetical protein